MRLLISQQLFSLHLLTVLLFISSFTTPFSSSCAWAAEDGAKSYQHLRHARGVIRGAAEARAAGKVEVADLERRQPSQEDGLIGRTQRVVRNEVQHQQRSNPPPSPAATESAAVPAHVVRDCLAQITPGPSLLRRQDQGQINALSGEIQRISESFRSVSQASQQVSQSSQQLSQSLQQATQRLIQTEASIASLRAQKDIAEQASRSATQAANDASRRADEASASASRAISAAFSEASRSASEMMAQVTRDMAASASSAIAQASESAIVIANSAASRIQQAQAEATAVRNDAQSQVQQAQGTAVSVTQAALAVVGGIVASSLITIVAFVLIMRYKRKKKQKKQMMNRLGGGSMGGGGGGRGSSTDNVTAVRGPPIGDYKMADYDNESNYSSSSPPPSSRYSAVGYPADVKEPLPVLDRDPNSGRKPGVGVGTGGSPGGFKLGHPPAPKSNNKFTLFPSPSTSSPNKNNKRGSGVIPNSARGSKSIFPTLDTWLRNGTSVSPFTTVNKGAAAALGNGNGGGNDGGGVGIATTTEGRKSPEWPIRRP